MTAAAAPSAWAFGWEALAAIGTLVLALATWRLARFTRDAVARSAEQIELSRREIVILERQTGALQATADAARAEVEALVEQTRAIVAQASATQRQVELSAAALEASSRPVLVGLSGSRGWRRMDTRDRPLVDGQVSIEFNDGHSALGKPNAVYFEATDEKLYCSIPLVNVGAGVAFIQLVALLSEARVEWPLTGRVTRAVVPAGEATRSLFVAVRRQSDGSPSDWESIAGLGGRGFVQFKIRVVCTGAAPGIATVTELTATQIPSGDFIYIEQRVWDGEEEPRRLLISTDNISM